MSDSQYILLLIIGVLIILFLLYNTNITQSSLILEHFGDYDIAKRNTYVDTLYETSLKTAFAQYPKFICNILPISNENDCKKTDGSLYTRDLYPVHIIKVFDGNYLAAFNDGKIYTKDSINDKFWSGPLAMSMPEDTQPLRMINLTADGTLLGVAYNNKLYKKLAPTNQKLKGYKKFETRWQLIPKCDNIIYAMYLSDSSSNSSNTANDQLIGINTTGMLVNKSVANMASNEFTVMSNEPFPVLKIYFDKNGFMLGIGADFKLYKKASLDWSTSTFDLLEGGNPTLINDVIYDNDAKLFGLVMLPTMGLLELQKQQQTYYLSAFLPMEFTVVSKDSKESQNTNVITDLDIIKFKTGANLSNLVGVADPLLLDNPPDIVDNLLKFESEGKLRQFCVDKGYLSKSEYQNYELLNKINDQKSKIGKLNDLLASLITQDPDKAKIQEINPLEIKQ
jgi:hypothetical protein